MKTLLLLALSAAFALPQSSEKVLLASIQASAVDNGAVSELVWNGKELVVLVAVPKAGAPGGYDARFYALPGPGVELRRLPAPPAARDAYWKMKASRTSPTGLGKIVKSTDSTLPMAGIGSLEGRLEGAADFGAMNRQHDIRLNSLLLYSSKARDPYDGEVWAWSPADQNQIAYIDGKGDLWIADADGDDPRRLLKGDFTLPAWSLDGSAVAVVERNAGKKRWDVFVVPVPRQTR
jgi:hypothetical protein